MVRAVEGMVEEMDAIIIAFFIAIIFFQFATAATSFVVMEKDGAWWSLGIYIIGTYIWYRYCIRIYNRFKLRDVGFSWKEDDEHKGPQVRSSIPTVENPMSSRESSTKSTLSEVSTKTKSTLSVVAVNKSNFSEGYLTAKGLNSGLFSSEWNRFYFVFEGDEFFYYKSKEVYKENPKNSIKNRAISLADYIINTNQDGAGALYIILQPSEENDKRKKWEFR
jgi:hypothetical protein